MPNLETSQMWTLGADPKLEYTPKGVAKCTLWLKSADAWRDKNTQQWEYRNDLSMNPVLWAEMAEWANDNLRKGDKVITVGKYVTQEGTDGKKYFTYKISSIGKKATPARTQQQPSTQPSFTQPDTPAPF